MNSNTGLYVSTTIMSQCWPQTFISTIIKIFTDTQFDVNLITICLSVAFLWICTLFCSFSVCMYTDGKLSTYWAERQTNRQQRINKYTSNFNYPTFHGLLFDKRWTRVPDYVKYIGQGLLSSCKFELDLFFLENRPNPNFIQFLLCLQSRIYVEAGCNNNTGLWLVESRSRYTDTGLWLVDLFRM